jgi:hypothetical protein
MRNKPKNKYVLGEGYPFVTLSNDVRLYKSKDKNNEARVVFDANVCETEKYRLVLERVRSKK